MNAAGFDAFGQPIAQPAKVIALQFLLDRADLFFGFNKFSRLGGVLIHHHVKGQMHVALDAIHKVIDFLTPHLGERDTLCIQPFGQLK